jgi:O-methyltransferase involved in polyketide biosynthesis
MNAPLESRTHTAVRASPTDRGVSAKRKVVLSKVQETLLMPLCARAAQSKKWFCILNDPKAVEIVEALDYDFSKFKNSPQTQVGCVLRTLQFDVWVKDFLARHPSGTIVEVGAGLNSRFERTDNGHARFFELDLPEAMTVRKLFYDENDRRTQITGSVLDADWITQVKASDGPYLIIIEGVLMYLTEADIRRLFATIAREMPGSHVGFDSLSQRAVGAQHRLAAMRHFDATFTWGIEEVRSIEAWGDGFVCLDSVNLRHVAIRNRHVIPVLIQMIAAAAMTTVRRSAVNDYWMSLFRLGPA